MKIGRNLLSNIMAFNEQSARKIIEFLLKDDCYEYKRWLKQIKKFNAEQIKNLLEGNRENLGIYQIKNKDIFDKLVLKFENYSQITFKWYENEENYQYLKQLWKNYICIEDINEKITNEQQLTDYLESNNVPYSKWPDKVKEEFKEATEDTIGTYIHEEDIKKTLIQQHSMFRNCFTAFENLLKSFGNLFPDAESEAEEKYKTLGKKSSIFMVGSLFGTIASQFITSANTSINNKLLEKCLVKQIMQYIPDKCDAKNIALDIIKKCTKKEGNVNWLVKGYKFLTIEDLDADGSTRLSGYHENFNVNLDSKNSETLSITKKIATIFKSKMVCGAVVIASVINLGFSIIEFLQISELTKTIKGKQYNEQLEKIKQRFKSHMTEIDISNFDDPHFVEKINYLKSNIELDKESLKQLLIEIKMDIKSLEQKKKESIFGACISGAIGVVSAVGAIATTGGMSLIYGLSTLGNVIAGGTHILDARDCINLIDDLIKIQEEAKKESEEIEKQIKKLNLILKQKELPFPNFYEAFSEILEKEKRRYEKFGF